MCVDYKVLNSNTVHDHFSLPLIVDHISKLSKANCFTVQDVAAGFHQIPIVPESVECRLDLLWRFKLITLPRFLSTSTVGMSLTHKA